MKKGADSKLFNSLILYLLVLSLVFSLASPARIDSHGTGLSQNTRESSISQWLNSNIKSCEIDLGQLFKLHSMIEKAQQATNPVKVFPGRLFLVLLASLFYGYLLKVNKRDYPYGEQDSCLSPATRVLRFIHRKDGKKKTAHFS